MIAVEELIELYQLQPHPEGGYFQETYRSDGIIPAQMLPKKFNGDRCYSTAIYFLLPEGTKSRLHRINSDEIWHFYLGGSMTLIQLHEEYGMKEIILGSYVSSGEKLQYVVPAGWWFGSYPNPGSKYSFVGCTVAPGFDFADFEIGERSQLLKTFPNAADIINKLT